MKSLFNRAITIVEKKKTTLGIEEFILSISDTDLIS